MGARYRETSNCMSDVRADVKILEKQSLLNLRMLACKGLFRL